MGLGKSRSHLQVVVLLCLEAPNAAMASGQGLLPSSLRYCCCSWQHILALHARLHDGWARCSTSYAGALRP